MKQSLLLLLLCAGLTSASRAQKGTFSFPPVAGTGRRTADFVPKGWERRDTVTADWNGDGLTDAALVVERTEGVVMPGNSCESDEKFQPKMLLILFRQPDQTYRLSLTATRLFGDCNWGVQGFDAYTGLSTRRNTLGIEFLTGGTNRNVLSYFARYQNNGWYVIGARSNTYWAGHMETGEGITDINLVTGVRESYRTEASGKRTGYRKDNIGKREIRLEALSPDAPIPFDE